VGLLTVLAVTGLAGIGAFQTESLAGEVAYASALTPADRKAIAWFDSLGFPDLAGKKCVRVATGKAMRIGDAPWQNSYRVAFLLEEHGESFTVFAFDLSTKIYTKTPAETAEAYRVGYEVLDLKQFATAQLASLRGSDDADNYFQQYSERISHRPEVFVLARACAANGHDGVAHELIAEAAKLSVHWGPDEARQAKGLVEKLSADVAHSRMWQAVEAFGDASIGREELLLRFQFIVEHFPRSEYSDRARRTTELLAQMIEEDRVHARENRKPLEEMTIDERVAELIFQLRDQNGQPSYHGTCDIFNVYPDERSPAHDLVDIGFDAVPQLIEAVDDRRFTRSVDGRDYFFFSHHALRVGDCAARILARIAGRKFDVGGYAHAARVENGRESAKKRQIKAWWADVQRKGEKQVLIEGVAAADRNALSQANRLLDKYPDDALEPIVRAARAAAEPGIRRWLVEALGQITGDGPVPFLLEELEKGPHLSSRVAAADCLHQRQRPEAVPAMIAEWQRITKAARARPAPRGPVRGMLLPREDGKVELIGFLAYCDDASAIRALTDNFSCHPIDLRMNAVEAIGGYGHLGAEFIVGHLLDPELHGSADRRELADAVETFLVAALEDTGQQLGMSGSWGGEPFRDPRICDIAGHVLSQGLPEKYTFDLEADLHERDRQRIAAINVWRRERKLPLLEVPERKSVAPARPEDLRR